MSKKSSEKPDRKSRIVAIVTALVLLIGPLPLLGYGVSRVVGAVDGLAAAREASAAREFWPTVDGEIARAEIVEEKSLLGPVYRAEVDYSYETDSGEYDASRITFNDKPFSRRSEAQAVIDSFAVGSTVAVFFNPLDPAQSALSMTAPGGSIAELVMGLVITLIFGAVYVVIIRQGTLKNLFSGGEE